MSSFAVTAERLVIHAHSDPEVERLESAQVGEYRAVVPRGQYRTGDWAIYIPEQAIVPDELLAEMDLTGRLAGPKKNRVKAMRFRGELSQGLVCSPRVLAGVDLAAANEGDVDFAKRLGIVKWVPEVPASLSGEIVPAPQMMSWIEIENIKRYPNIFASGEPVTASEKIHGSATCVTWITENGELFVSSKGFAARKLALAESETNLYWRAVRSFGIESVLRAIGSAKGIARVALYGEVYGAGVQDLHYGETRKDTPGLAVFDIAIDEVNGRSWLAQDRVREVCVDHKLNFAPVLYEGGYDYGALAALAEGNTRLGGGVNVREGLVVRSVPERRSAVVNGRAIAKFVGNSYLTRAGGSEFE
jgi:RNA ligase (TIGR02306 family)